MDFDVIVIGSGFGGAITSCRLAEKGKKVLVLERGKKWDRTTYPRELEDEWIWSHADPEHYHGWTDLRRFKGMAVIAGAGVGGGSLIYANVSAVPPESVFASGWPPEITFAGLQSYYATVADILDIHEVPQNQWSPRVHLMKEAADKLGQSQRFGPAKLAVSFDNDLVYDFDTEPDLKNSKRFINKHGVEQGTCAHLGECDIGCRADAKNTLDKNYLHIAEKNGTEIRPLHLVTKIEAIASGYRVYHKEFKNGGSIPSSTTAERVILGARDPRRRFDGFHGTPAAMQGHSPHAAKSESFLRETLEQQRRFSHACDVFASHALARSRNNHRRGDRLPRCQRQREDLLDSRRRHPQRDEQIFWSFAQPRTKTTK